MSELWTKLTTTVLSGTISLRNPGDVSGWNGPLGWVRGDALDGTGLVGWCDEFCCCAMDE